MGTVYLRVQFRITVAMTEALKKKTVLLHLEQQKCKFFSVETTVSVAKANALTGIF